MVSTGAVGNKNISLWTFSWNLNGVWEIRMRRSSWPSAAKSGIRISQTPLKFQENVHKDIFMDVFLELQRRLGDTDSALGGTGPARSPHPYLPDAVEVPGKRP